MKKKIHFASFVYVSINKKNMWHSPARSPALAEMVVTARLLLWGHQPHSSVNTWILEQTQSSILRMSLTEQSIFKHQFILNWICNDTKSVSTITIHFFICSLNVKGINNFMIQRSFMQTHQQKNATFGALTHVTPASDPPLPTCDQKKEKKRIGVPPFFHLKTIVC